MKRKGYYDYSRCIKYIILFSKNYSTKEKFYSISSLSFDLCDFFSNDDEVVRLSLISL